METQLPELITEKMEPFGIIEEIEGIVSSICTLTE